MANNFFKIKKGLIVNGSGSTVVDIQGNSGQLFSITDSLTGVLMSVNDISGLPILEVSDNDTVKMGTFGAEGLIVEGSTIILPNTTNSTGDFLTIGGNNKIAKRTSAQVLGDLNAVPTSRTLTAGDGLSGGGDLTANRSFAVDSTVVRTTGNQTIGGTKTFSSTIVGSINGNAATATTLETARTIGGVSFNGSANINLPGVNIAGNQNTTGNAATATTLETARTINGTSFNGSANITTANWGTARTITIGSTGKSVNGSGTVSWSLAEIGAQAALTNPITGTGTAGQVSFFTGTTTQTGDNGLFWDNSNKRLGIGTTSPTQRLQIGEITSGGSTSTPDTITLGQTFSNTAGTNLKLRVYDNGSAIGGFGVSSNQLDYAVWNNTADHVFYAGVSELLRIKGNGDVGIGTTATTGLFNVQGTSYFADDIYLRDGSVSSGDILVRIYDSSDDGIIDVYRNNSVVNRIHGNGNSFFNAGDVGIGTTSPDNKLHVVSGVAGEVAQFTGAIANRGLSIRSETSTDASALVVFNSQSGGAQGKFSFETDGTERWGILNTGILQSNGAQTIRTSTGNLTLATNGGNGHILLTPNGTGNVGIGTTSPSALVDLRRLNSNETTPLLRIQDGDNPGLRIWQTAVPERLVNIKVITSDSANGSLLLGSQSATSSIRFATGTSSTYTERMRITSAGDVGINETSPSERLHVNGRARIETIDNATGDFATISGTGVITRRTAAQVLGDLNAVPTSRTLTINSGDGLSGGASQDLTANRTWNLSVDSTVVRTTGNQTIGGIKTFTSEIRSAESVIINYTGTNQTKLARYSGNGTPVPFDIDMASTNISDDDTFGTLHLTRSNHNNSANNVGSNLYFRLKNDSGTLTEYAGIGGRKRGNTSGDLIFYTFGRTERMRILNNGNVLIGTTSDAGEKLSVSGNGNFTGHILVGDGTQPSASDADITIRRGVSFAGIDLKSTRTSGNVGGIRSYQNNTLVSQLLFQTNGNATFDGTISSTFSGALSGNATTATTLQTARNINGTSFNGSANITTANWGTARTLTIGSTGKSVNGGGNVSWSLAEIGAQAAGDYVTLTGNQDIDGTKTFSSTIVGSINGNAATATTLETARNINGTSFNGSANITTANWGTARTLTIGATGKSVNGSGDVSWSLAEIGAQAALTNPITGTGTSGQVSFFNGTTTQSGDNGLFWDNTNKRLGIGTTSPSQALEVIGKAQLSVASNLAPINLPRNGTSNPSDTVDGDIWYRSSNLYYNNLGTIRVIAHTGSFGAMSIAEGQAGTATTSRYMRADRLGPIISAYAPTLTGTGASGTWDINITGNAATATTATNLSRQVIAGNGLDGGGTLNADRTLNVGAGDGISVSSTAVAVDSTVLRTNVNQTITSRKIFSGSNFYISGKPEDSELGFRIHENGGRIFFDSHGTTGENGDMIFRTSTAGAEERLRIFGVGTASQAGIIIPSQQSFYWTGKTNNGAQGLRIFNNVNSFIDSHSTSSAHGDIIIRTGNNGETERMRIKGNTGRLGLNTTSPSHLLHINGTPRIDSTATAPSAESSAIDFTGEVLIIGSDQAVLTTPSVWLKININGTDYKIPAYA